MSNLNNSNNTQAAAWNFTINNPEKYGWTHKNVIETIQLMNPVYFCMATETSETGTEHIHIYMKRNSAIRFSTLKQKFPEAHIEKAMGTPWQNREYITKTGKWAETNKSETVVEGSFYEWGEIPVKDMKTNDRMREVIHLIKVEKMPIMEIIQKFPDMGLRVKSVEDIAFLCMEEEAMKVRNIEVNYVFGIDGIPKIENVLQKYNPKDVCRITNYSKNNSTRFDSYNGQSVLVFDQFYGQIDLDILLNYLSPYKTILPARFRDRWALYTTVYILSPYPLELLYEAEQQYTPALWRQFFNKISHVYECQDDGTLVEVSKDTEQKEEE